MTDDTTYQDLADRWAGAPMTADQLRYVAAVAEWDAANAGLQDAATEAARIIDAADSRWAAASAALQACEVRPGIPRKECDTAGMFAAM
jgi:hypothetical protein